MAFRGYFALNGQEFANSSRLLAHILPGVPVSDDAVATPMECSCEITVPYDDSWTGLEAALGDGPYVLTNAPWYDASKPESVEFAGVWVMDVTGFDTVPTQRDVGEAICAGGVPGPARDASRKLTFSALVVACTNAGARYGLNWLSCVLRQANVRGGVDLIFYKAHPEDTTAAATDLRRTMYGTVLTDSPKVTEVLGKGKAERHRQASVFRVEWEMVCTNPYMYGEVNSQTVNWDSIVNESITWAHAPDCEDMASCELPTIYNAECMPPEVTLDPAEIPVCGGCLPLCAIERRTWELDGALAVCEEMTVTMRVTNDGDEPLTVNFYWQPCGSTDRCDRTAALTVSGLPAGLTVVADSITGRPFIDNAGQRQRQVGIIGTPTGAPWRPTRLDTMVCWELVAENAPGADYSVVVELRDRDA